MFYDQQLRIRQVKCPRVVQAVCAEAENHYWRSKSPSTNVSLQSRDKILQYFDQLKEVLEEHDLIDCS